MAVVERYYWEPNDLEEFFSLHREIYDQHLRKAGASDITLGRIAQIGSCMLRRYGLKTLRL